ncbi:TetR/AcrR family transcriptional regulator [Streptosporangium saharense]|uniref:AcrR family transcriptional regulator n=1 Tax=Streptosporangium saharense TaxID=1706840 RepID=A0A7W7VM68_9ACTN|nr:TetR/AcrR family transcriptional regulator [Streptosporangium saharense]MBB4915481.1 AcrR family transcriptional regulator [Streptosporangium saharense]
MTSADGGERELILRVATRLFAALGYDGTSTSQITEAAGVDVATLNENFGGRRELYLAVMERAHLAELAHLEGTIAKISAAPPGDPIREPAGAVHLLLDSYIDFCVSNPDLDALWMHRWLSDASDVTEPERQYVQPVIRRISEVLQSMAPGSADVMFTVWTVTWSAHAFSRAGVLDEEGNHWSPDDPEILRRFRAYMHELVHHALGLPGSPPAP